MGGAGAAGYQGGQRSCVPPRHPGEDLRGDHGRSRLSRSQSRWKRDTRAAPVTSLEGRGVTAGHGATVVRQRNRMYTHGTNATAPRNRPRFRRSVEVVSQPATGSTTTRPRVYAKAPIERTVARCPASKRRFRNAVVRAGARLQTMYSGIWRTTAPGERPAPYIPKNAPEARSTRSMIVPNSPRTLAISPAMVAAIAGEIARVLGEFRRA